MRVVVADALGVFREGVRRILLRESDFEVVEASTLEQLVSIVEARCPDVVLVDLNLPPAGGIEAVREVASRCTSSIVLWHFDFSHEQVIEAAAAGAHGILRKEISVAALVRALRAAGHGEAPIARDLTTVLLEALHGAQARIEAVERAAALSEREREVLRHVATGERNRQIADELAISEFTVKRHVQNILQKLGLPSRGAAGALYDAAYGRPDVARSSV